MDLGVPILKILIYVLKQGGRHSSVLSSTASQSIRLEPPPALKTSCFLNEPAKQEACLPSAHLDEELVPKDESVNRKSVNLPDQKMLKVRIKVGSDNLSTQKNAAIYSGLGLDVSPSSSPDDSPSGSEGMSQEPQDGFLESPAHILRVSHLPASFISFIYCSKLFWK